MSHLVTRNILDACPIKGPRRAVMMALAHYAGDDGECWPSQQRLADDTKLSLRGIKKIMDALIAANEIELIEKGNGRGKSSRYRLTKYAENGEPVLHPLPPKPESKRVNGATEKGEPQNTKGEPGDIKGEPPQGKVNRNTNRIPKNTKNTNWVTVFPGELDCDEFKTAWAEWLQYREQRKPKLSAYSEIGTKKQLSRVRAWGLAGAIAAIDESIAQNYQGIFPAKQHNGSHRKPTGNPKVNYAEDAS